MKYKIIVKERINIYRNLTTSKDLMALDGYFESEPFYADENTPTPELFDIAWPNIEPHIKNMRWDNAEIKIV